MNKWRKVSIASSDVVAIFSSSVISFPRFSGKQSAVMHLSFIVHQQSSRKLTAKIGSNFLRRNKVLTSIELPNATKIGDDFLWRNETLKSINLPDATEIGDSFLYCNKSLIKMNIPKISPNDNRNIKRLKMVVAKNKIKQTINPFDLIRSIKNFSKKPNQQN